MSRRLGTDGRLDDELHLFSQSSWPLRTNTERHGTRTGPWRAQPSNLSQPTAPRAILTVSATTAQRRHLPEAPPLEKCPLKTRLTRLKTAMLPDFSGVEGVEELRFPGEATFAQTPSLSLPISGSVKKSGSVDNRREGAQLDQFLGN